LRFEAAINLLLAGNLGYSVAHVYATELTMTSKTRRGTRTQQERSGDGDAASLELRLFTVKQVSEIIGVVPKTVRRWIRTGELRAMGKGRLLRIPEWSLLDFIEKHMK
jgi:excisionase family DNA binding protein